MLRTFAFLVAVLLLAEANGAPASQLSYLSQPSGFPQVAPGVYLIGTFQNADIRESSGVIASHRVRGAFWTHNDDGPAVLYAFFGDGTALGQWTIEGVNTHDWEDIAHSAGRIYVADIGKDQEHPGTIYVVPEPNPRKSGTVRVLRQIDLTYPDGPFDSESFFVSRGYGYLIEKEDGNAHLYRFKLAGRTAGELEKVLELNTDAPVTGADIAGDGRRLAVVTEMGAYLFLLPKQLPAEDTVQPILFVPAEVPRMEGGTFTPYGLVTTSESGEILLFTNPLFRARPR